MLVQLPGSCTSFLHKGVGLVDQWCKAETCTGFRIKRLYKYPQVVKRLCKGDTCTSFWVTKLYKLY